MEKIILILVMGTLFLGGFEGMVLAEEDKGSEKRVQQSFYGGM